MNTEYPMMVLYNQSLNQEHNLFNSYANKGFNFQNKSYWYKDSKKILKPLQGLIDTSYKLLSDNGYQIDKNIYLLEFQSYNLFNNKFQNLLDWHIDDYGGISEKVNTIIYYLKKDIRIKKGNFLYINNSESKCELHVEDNMILMIDGRIKHKPDDLEGYGSRNSIVVQFQRI